MSEAEAYESLTEASTGFTVYYSLPVFHEIDFVVSEGFRRIPHGGIENGGLLLGEFVPDGIRIDRSVPIECSHAFGPSFVLSNEDVERLRAQISRQTVGWFISRSRGQLVFTDKEAALIRDLFPPGAITVLVKPEKFKATRFAFFTADSELDGTAQSFVLPLVASKTDGRRQERPPQIQQEPPPSRPVQATLPPAVETKPVTRAALVEGSGPLDLLQIATSRATWVMMGAAIAFACLAVWGFYRRSGPPEVPLSVRAHGSTLVISWPSDESRMASHARLRVNDGDSQLLSREDKNSGTTSIENSAEDVKLTLTLSRWGRRSDSVDRYLKTANASIQSVNPPPTSVPAVPGR